jgi:DNA-binding Lrp family transcriptional regulator
MSPATNIEMDDLDLALATLLQQDARTPTVDLARALGVSRHTVTKRLDRLLDEGLLHLLAETDFQGAGKDYVLVLGLCCESNAVDIIAEQLADLDETLVVVNVTGRFNLEVVAAVETYEAFIQLLSDTIPSIPAISSCSPSLCLEIVKFESNKVPYSP